MKVPLTLHHQVDFLEKVLSFHFTGVEHLINGCVKSQRKEHVHDQSEGENGQELQQTDKHHVCSTLFGSTEVSIANRRHRRCHKVELINVDGHVFLHRVAISSQRNEACLSCAEENVHACH